MGISYLAILTIVYFGWIILSGNIHLLYMIWNLFLAWIPLIIAMQMNKLSKKGGKKIRNNIIVLLLGIVWLLFYPNSPYIITDFIHLSTKKFYVSNPNYIPYGLEPKVLYNKDLKVWLEFINIAIGVWLGYVVGFISLYINQKLIRKKANNFISWIFVLVVNMLSGFAIYLGRFVRWNSWDVIKPRNIIAILTKDINSQSLKYTFMFGVFCLILYLINYSIIKLVKEKNYV